MITNSEAKITFIKKLDPNLTYLANTSNFIREKLLNHLISINAPLEDAYHIIHDVHFLNEKKALSIGVDDKHKSHDTSLSVREHDSISLLPLSTLHRIKSKLFSTIQRTHNNFLEYITTLDMLLTISHIPHDGAGRTNEDFLVLYALKNGKNITYSEDSYRGQLNKNSIVHERLINLQTFLGEIREGYIKDSIKKSEIEMVCTPNKLDYEEIKRMKQERDPNFIDFQIKKHRIGLTLLDTLQNPNNIIHIKNKFPNAFFGYKKVMSKAEKQTYQII